MELDFTSDIGDYGVLPDYLSDLGPGRHYFNPRKLWTPDNMNEKVTIDYLQGLKQAGEKIAALTAYDASFARIMDEAGVEIILVGDSLGMVLHGAEDTLSVSMQDMIYHCKMVSRVSRQALVVVDMPYRSYETGSEACDNALELMEMGGAEVVKLEGGADKAKIVEDLVSRGIPVCGHIGLQPQSVRKYGGYKVQGRNEEQAELILADAKALQAAGACMMVLECIPVALAERITNEVSVPAIGIGAGADCDGQVLVIYDVLGLSPHSPYMAKNFLNETGSIQSAVREYIYAVKTGTFPGMEHSFI